MKILKVPKNLRIFKKAAYPPHNTGLNLEGEITKTSKRKRKINTNLLFFQFNGLIILLKINMEKILKN